MKYFAIFIGVSMLFCVNILAQNKISADVKIETLNQGKKTIIQKQIFLDSDGTVWVHIIEPNELISRSNTLGECVLYNIEENEILNISDPDFSSNNEPLVVFSSQIGEDLGLQSLGFELQKQEKEANRIVKTFIPKSENKKIKAITMVYQDDLPIYSGYFDHKDREFRKIYYSDYEFLSLFAFPKVITEIDLDKDGNKIINRQTYSNIRQGQDVDSSYFNYVFPKDAKQVKTPSKNHSQVTKDKQLLVKHKTKDPYPKRKVKYGFSNVKYKGLVYHALSSAMYVYQSSISPLISKGCAFSPSCSAYSKALIQEYGIFKGVIFTSDRLTRCTRIALSDKPKDYYSGTNHKHQESVKIYSLDYYK